MSAEGPNDSLRVNVRSFERFSRATMLIAIVREGRMARDVRARMVESAVELLARRGLLATSFSEVLERSGAPRGSVYHHFPGGKDELVGSALDLGGSELPEGFSIPALRSFDEVLPHAGPPCSCRSGDRSLTL